MMKIDIIQICGTPNSTLRHSSVVVTWAVGPGFESHVGLIFFLFPSPFSFFFFSSFLFSLLSCSLHYTSVPSIHFLTKQMSISGVYI